MQPVISYYEDGKKAAEKWQLNGILHRLDGPVYTNRYKNDNKYKEEWYLDDKYHRVDGPAYIEWYENGKKKEEIWNLNGILQYVLNYRKRRFKI